MPIILAAVADDDTGATDLAGMLADQGLRCILVIEVPDSGRLAEWATISDAVILGIASRAVAPAVAYERTRRAVRLLMALTPKVVQLKYCSTFDSTAEGNIGTSIDAALDELGEAFTIALPALPVNGRTTYMGYHFVEQKLLSDSPMRHHPLTPMTNPNLVTHLQNQTRRRVGLVPCPVVTAGSELVRRHLVGLRSNGVSIAVVDCTSDTDLETICEAIHDLRFITGSSAPALKLPTIWRREGWWTPADCGPLLPRRPARGCGVLIVSGSCSQATQLQNEWLSKRGTAVIELDGISLARSECPEASLVSATASELAAGRTCLLRTASSLHDVCRTHEWAHQRGYTESEIGSRIACRLAAIVAALIQCGEPEGLIVAGGETAGAVCRALHFAGLRVGRNIEPGVPLCLSLGDRPLPVVLKSGNFGTQDFYEKALTAIRSLNGC